MRWVLWPFSFLFSLITCVRNFTFNKGFRKIEQPDRPTICIGNLTTGGTGKTPWVQKLTHHFTQKNMNVSILSRGYRGRFKGVLELTDDVDPLLSGDEPLWLKKNTKARVLVSPKRILAARKALEAGPVDVFILDDGFQHRNISRSMDIVLVDASAPSQHYSMLPMGHMREGFSSLKRANVVIISKCNQASPERVNWLQEKVRPFLKSDSIYLADFKFRSWVSLFESRAELEPNSVALACGLGNPQAFVDTVSDQGITPMKTFLFKDHFYWTPDDVEKMTSEIKRASCKHLVITEKDAIKLSKFSKHFQEMGISVWVCKMQLQIRDRADDFFNKIDQVLEPSQ